MLSTMGLALTRTLALRVPILAFRSSSLVGFQRQLLTTGLLSRRALSTTPYLFAAAVRKKPTAKRTTSKSRATSRKGLKTRPKTKVKSKAKPKAKAKRKAKAKPKPKKPKVPAIVPVSERPPKRPPPPYIIFSSRTCAGAKTAAECVEANKNAAKVWKGMTDAEKQQFSDEYKVLLRDYQARRDKWFKDPKNSSILRRLNSRRAKDGKNRLHTPEGIKPKRPLTAFIRFVTELRSSGQISYASAPPNVKPAIWFSREAGTRWKALPQADKDKYTKAYRDEVSRRA